MRKSNSGFFQVAAYAFSLYYLITGIWPIVNLSSFMDVTGPKNDGWLVKTVSVLITSMGIGFLAGTIKKKFYGEYLIIALPAALGLMFIDCYYVYRQVISKIYLMDAAAQMLFIIVFILSVLQKKRLT